MAHPHWVARASARVVLVTYLTQLFAPVAYAMEGGVETQTSFDHFAHRGSEFAKFAPLSSHVKIAPPHPQKASLSSKIGLAESLSPQTQPQGLPTLSIQLDYLY